MRRYGITDDIFLIFIFFLFLAMLYGCITAIIDSIASPPLFLGGSSGIIITGLPVYFYYPNGIFLSILPVPFWTGIAFLMILYIILFAYLYRFNSNNLGTNPLKTPVGFVSGYGSVAFAISFLIILLLELLQTPILSPGLSSAEKSPLSFYYQLIYAPFIEELEFRILPLGTYVYLRQLFSKNRGSLLYSFLFPGITLFKSGRKIDRIDILMILATSTLFGYAHYAYGGWTFTKIPQAFLVGVFLGFGYMLYGPFVDIPLHFLFDGLAGIMLLPGDYLGGIYIDILYFFMIILSLAAVIILVAINVRNTRREKHASGINDYDFT